MFPALGRRCCVCIEGRAALLSALACLTFTFAGETEVHAERLGDHSGPARTPCPRMGSCQPGKPPLDQMQAMLTDDPFWTKRMWIHVGPMP